MNKYTLMDKINDFAAFKTCMQQAELEYVKDGEASGEPSYVGFEEFDSVHKFMDDGCDSLSDWVTGICLGVFNEFIKDPTKFGCYEIADSLACLQCGCRNYSRVLFLSTMFEDWKEFITYITEHEEELTDC